MRGKRFRLTVLYIRLIRLCRSRVTFAFNPTLLVTDTWRFNHNILASSGFSSENNQHLIDALLRCVCGGIGNNLCVVSRMTIILQFDSLDTTTTQKCKYISNHASRTQFTGTSTPAFG